MEDQDTGNPGISGSCPPGLYTGYPTSMTQTLTDQQRKGPRVHRGLRREARVPADARGDREGSPVPLAERGGRAPPPDGEEGRPQPDPGSLARHPGLVERSGAERPVASARRPGRRGPADPRRAERRAERRSRSRALPAARDFPPARPRRLDGRCGHPPGRPRRREQDRDGEGRRDRGRPPRRGRDREEMADARAGEARRYSSSPRTPPTSRSWSTRAGRGSPWKAAWSASCAALGPSSDDRSRPRRSSGSARSFGRRPRPASPKVRSGVGWRWSPSALPTASRPDSKRSTRPSTADFIRAR